MATALTGTSADAGSVTLTARSKESRMSQLSRGVSKLFTRKAQYTAIDAQPTTNLAGRAKVEMNRHFPSYGTFD